MDDDDDECMESNFGQIDQEEYRSLKIGEFRLLLFYFFVGNSFKRFFNCYNVKS